jgi:hypothetical protein
MSARDGCILNVGGRSEIWHPISNSDRRHSIGRYGKVAPAVVGMNVTAIGRADHAGGNLILRHVRPRRHAAAGLIERTMHGTQVELHRSSGDVFELTITGKLAYFKKGTDQVPTDEEVLASLR